MIVGFTGTRDGMTSEQHAWVAEFLDWYRPEIEAVHHGDCIGADAQFDALAHIYNLPVIIHPPDNDSRRAFCAGELRSPKPYLMRNRDIVEQCSVLLATPKESEPQGRGGTWFTINMCDRQPTIRDRIIIYPNGETNINTVGSPSYAHGIPG